MIEGKTVTGKPGQQATTLIVTDKMSSSYKVLNVGETEQLNT